LPGLTCRRAAVVKKAGPMSREKPTITIVTVVYNGERHLEDTIRSVLAMTYERLAYVVIDGGSTDGTVAVIKKYRDRISYWISEKDRGLYDAMNKGWAAAADDGFVLFLGAGDRIISLPEDPVQTREADVIYGRVRIGEQAEFRSTAGPMLRLFNTLHHQALLVRKGAHPAPPFDLRYRVYADFDFNQRLLKAKARFVPADDLTAYALPGGLSSRYAVREAFVIVRKNFGLLSGLLFLLFYAGSIVFGRFFGSRPFSALRSTR
jgi:glycosyltransferase involved in cell wall biosynthesis